MAEIEIQLLSLRYSALRVMEPGRVARLAASLAVEGQRAPVLVTAGVVLVDGYYRVAALGKLGRDLVDAVTLDVGEAEALVLAWRLQTGPRKTALEEGWMLRELFDAHGRTQTLLAEELRRPKSWVSERLGLVRVLPESVQDAVRQGKVPAQAAMKSLLPMARHDGAACAAMVGALGSTVTARQVERLYLAWRKADPVGRQRIVERPDLLLRTEEAPGAAVVPDAEEKLAADLESIVGMCGRARKAVRAGVFPRGNSVARRAWTQAHEAMAALQEEVARAES